MKTGCFFKLTLLSGFAALGLLAARVTQAQSPSGPITAAPSQSAPPTANGANQAPLPAPRTTILGAWKFNPEESDDPSKRRQESRGTNGGYGGGRGRMGGGYPGGGYGGYGRRGGESDEERQKMHELFTPAKAITLSMTGAEVDLVDDRDRKRAFMTDEKDPRGNKMSRTFELSSDGRQLYETLHMTTGRNNTPLVIRYVYDISEQTVTQSKQ